MVVEHEAELGSDALLYVVQAGDKADTINDALGFAITGLDAEPPSFVSIEDHGGQWFELAYAKDDSPHILICIEIHPDTDLDCMLNPSERVTTGSEGRTKQVPCQSFASHLIEKEMSAA